MISLVLWARHIVEYMSGDYIQELSFASVGALMTKACAYPSIIYRPGIKYLSWNWELGEIFTHMLLFFLLMMMMTNRIVVSTFRTWHTKTWLSLTITSASGP